MARNELTHLASLAALNRAVEALFSIGKAARLFFSGFQDDNSPHKTSAPCALSNLAETLIEIRDSTPKLGAVIGKMGVPHLEQVDADRRRSQHFAKRAHHLRVGIMFVQRTGESRKFTRDFCERGAP
jgi:hypothetical protein